MNPIWISRWAPIIALVLVFATGCGGKKKKGAVCTFGDDCPTGSGCYEEQCVTLCGTTSCSALQQCVVIDGKETCVEKGLVSIAGTETQDANDAGSEDTSSGLDSGSEDQSGLDTVGSEDFVSVDVEVDALAPLGLDCGTLGDGKFVVGQEKTLTMTIANASGTVTLTQVDPALPQDLTATVNGGSIDVGKLCKAPGTHSVAFTIQDGAGRTANVTCNFGCFAAQDLFEVACGNLNGSVQVHQKGLVPTCDDVQLTGGVKPYTPTLLNNSTTPVNFDGPNGKATWPYTGGDETRVLVAGDCLNTDVSRKPVMSTLEVSVDENGGKNASNSCQFWCVQPLALTCTNPINVETKQKETDLTWTIGTTDKKLSLLASGGWTDPVGANKYAALGISTVVDTSNNTALKIEDIFDAGKNGVIFEADPATGELKFGGICKKEGKFRIEFLVTDQAGKCYPAGSVPTACEITCNKSAPQDLTITPDPGDGMVTINKWMLMLDPGSVCDTLTIAWKELSSQPDLGGVIATLELTLDNPSALCRFLKVKYDLSGLDGGKSYALLVSDDGGATWHDMLSWVDTGFLYGQIFGAAGKLQVAIVELGTARVFSTPILSPLPPILTSEVLTRTDAKVISAQIAGTFKELRRISNGDATTTLELSFQNDQFQTKKLQYSFACSPDGLTLNPTDRSDRFDKILTKDGADPTKTSQNSVGASDILTSVGGTTVEDFEAATRLFEVVTQSAKELQMLTAVTIGGVSQLIEFVITSQPPGSNFFRTDLVTRTFAKRLLLARVRYEYFFGASVAELFFRSLWAVGQAGWQRLTIPGNCPVNEFELTYKLIEARVTADYLFVLASRRQAPSVSCIAPYLLEHLTLFVFDSNLRHVKSVDLPNLTMSFARHRGMLKPAGFFAVRKTANGYAVMIGANDATAVNADLDTCPGAPTATLTTSLKLAFIDLAINAGAITESVTISSAYTESQRIRVYNANHESECANTYTGPKGNLRRYVWTDQYFAIAVDRCGRTSGPLPVDRGGIMIFSYDGQTLVANISAPYVPDLVEGTNGLLLAQNAQRAPVSAKDPKEVHVFRIDKDVSDKLQVTMLSVYPRRPGTYVASEDCHYVYGVCGDKLLCVRIDKDTEDMVYLQLLSQGGSLLATTATTSVLGSNAAGRGFYVIGVCDTDDNFQWATYNYGDTVPVPASAPILQQCL